MTPLPSATRRTLAGTTLGVILLLAAASSPAHSAPTFVTQWGSFGNAPGQMNYPYGIVVGPNGNVYVSDQYNFRIVQYSSTGTFIRSWGSQGSGQGQFGITIGLGVDAQGRVYVADYSNQRIQVFTADGQFIRLWGGGGSGSGQLGGPRDVAVDDAGLVHVVEESNARIQVFTPEGVFVSMWDVPAAPVTADFGPDGNLYVGHGGGGIVSVWTPAGAHVRTWGSLDVIAGVMVDDAARVYVVEFQTHLVRQFTPDGTPVQVWGGLGSSPGQFDHPVDVAIDDGGIVYVLDMYNHRVQKFSDPIELPAVVSLEPEGGRVGDPVVIIGLGFSEVSAVAFNGVPAPIDAATDTRIDTRVPVGATTGPVTVTIPQGTGTSARDFFVGETPEVTGADPLEGKVGAEVTITGLHFTGATRVSFGPSSDAAFTVDSDQQITATVDGAAESGPITVTTPAAIGTSSFNFTVIPFDTAARIVRVRDVPRDEGGLVAVTWVRSDFDRLQGFVTGYRLWRRAPPGAATRAAMVGAAVDYWEPVGEVPAARLDGYAILAATTEDSTEDSNHYTAFFVQTLTANAGEFYNSAVDSGYSVDNRKPKKPPKINATYTPRGALLSWGENEERDLWGYRLFRGDTLGFDPDTSNQVYAGPDTSFNDTTGTGGYYLLAAEDRHGNRSHYALVTPREATVGVALMVATQVGPREVRVRWYVIGQPNAQVFVERRTLNGTWQRRADLVADGAGMVSYRDQEVVAGQRLGYRLGMLEEEQEVFGGEVWVDVPEARLALLGIGPNPLLAGEVMRVRFVVPNDGRVTLRLLDIAGRTVLREELGLRAAGAHEALVSWRRELAAGIYVARLEHDGRAVSSKVGVLR